MGSTEVLYLKMTRFILFLCMLLYSSSDVSTILVNSSSEVTSSYSFTSWGERREGGERREERGGREEGGRREKGGERREEGGRREYMCTSGSMYLA